MGFRDDILGQPDNLRRSAAVVHDGLLRADLSAFGEVPLLFTGMGASLCAVMPAASALRAAGRSAFALLATELLEIAGGALGSACIGISQSGRSTETVEAFRRLSIPRFAITNTATGPLAEAADMTLPIGSAEDAGVSVMTYTASLFAVAALAARLGAAPFDEGADLPGLVADVIERSEPVAARVAERLDGVRALDVVGVGTSVASAAYTALVIREAARIPTAWFDTHQYLHGPIEVAEASVGAVVFGNAREVSLAADLASYGVPVLLITDTDVSVNGMVEVIRLPALDGLIAPILQAIPGQLVAESLARMRGLSPGAFRHPQDDTKVKPR